MAQTAPAPVAAASAPTGTKVAAADEPAVVVITGQRAALQSAQKIKQNSDEIVDSIVADDMKLPDRSVTEVLQRVVGVTIDHTMSRGDPEHFSIEGSGVMVRGLTYVRSELNGRDSFSANGGRALSFEDVSPELLSQVKVYKNPSAEQIEGGIAGLIDLRTAMPFDYKGFKGGLSASESYSKLRAGRPSPSFSGLLSNTWDTSLGKFGALVDLAYSESATRSDKIQVEPYYPRTDIVAGSTVWVPKGAEWRSLNFDRKRQGLYAALQWKNNSGLESSLTYFKSKYKMNWAENAIFAQSDPYKITVDDGATYTSQGALLTGTIRDAADGGINMGADTRVSTRKSNTQDLSWHLDWKASNAWSFSTDLQFIRADTKGFDSTVATGVKLPDEKLNLGGSTPSLMFSDADRAYLADPANYYWAFTMENLDRSKGRENAWRGDAQYTFENSWLSDFRFGVRLTDRSAHTTNSVGPYHWAAITQPWQVGWDINHTANLNDPRFSGNTQLLTFKNFFNGKSSMPALIFPDVSTAAGYPDSYAKLHAYHDVLCTEQHGGDASACPAWTPATFGTDPTGDNNQDEHSQAAYGQLRFAFDDLKYPIDGMVGLRYIHTNALASGYTTFSTDVGSLPSGSSGVTVPEIVPFAKLQTFQHSYDDLLPSLNLKMKAADNLQFRFAWASAITRPDFSQLQANTTLSQSAQHTGTDVTGYTQTGTGTGNPLLKPTKSNQIDLTGEWYFAPTGSFTVAAFDKELKDIIINSLYNVGIPDTSGNIQQFVTTAPINGAKGSARGFEVAFQTYFTKLPGWLAGFGVQANYTFVDSKTKLYNPVNQAYCSGGNSATNLNLNLNGCDTDGRTFGNLPLANLSRNSYNLALMFDQGPISARLAYTWRSKSLQAVNVNGTQGTDGSDSNPDSATFGQHGVGLAYGLPTWADSYGLMDASIFYKISDNLTVGLEGHNLLDSTFRQLMQQHVGTMGRAWDSTGRSYMANMRYSF
ncbi:MAG: TonB-dependent receptor [Betaproteobacteria bacterium]